MHLSPTGDASVIASGVLANSYGLAIDKSGNFFVANSTDNSIQMIFPSGTPSVFSNSPLLDRPFDVLFDDAGELLVSNANGTIVKINPFGEASVFATGLGIAMGMEFDGNGNLFVVSNDKGQIFKVDKNGKPTVFASTMSFPWDLAFDSDGSLYIVSYWYGSILKYDAVGNSSVFAQLPGSYTAYMITIAKVPEPGAASLFAIGGLTLHLRRRFRH
jgi:sugar lactone lactonase YvrE